MSVPFGRAVLTLDDISHPERLGPDRERLRRIVAPTLARPAFAALLDGLIADGRVARTGPWVHLPDHRVQLASADEPLWRDGIEPLLRAAPYNPPGVRDIARQLGLEEERTRRLLKQLAGMGEVFQVAHDHFFTRAAVAELSAIALELAGSEGEARAASFRDRIGGGRKVAIHILIAATNAISDVYAMGATPVLALALAILEMPVNTLPLEVIRRIMEGGAEVCFGSTACRCCPPPGF